MGDLDFFNDGCDDFRVLYNFYRKMIYPQRKKWITQKKLRLMTCDEIKHFISKKFDNRFCVKKLYNTYKEFVITEREKKKQQSKKSYENKKRREQREKQLKQIFEKNCKEAKELNLPVLLQFVFNFQKKYDNDDVYMKYINVDIVDVDVEKINVGFSLNNKCGNIVTIIDRSYLDIMIARNIETNYFSFFDRNNNNNDDPNNKKFIAQMIHAYMGCMESSRYFLRACNDGVNDDDEADFQHAQFLSVDKHKNYLKFESCVNVNSVYEKYVFVQATLSIPTTKAIQEKKNIDSLVYLLLALSKSQIFISYDIKQNFFELFSKLFLN